VIGVAVLNVRNVDAGLMAAFKHCADDRGMTLRGFVLKALRNALETEGDDLGRETDAEALRRIAGELEERETQPPLVRQGSFTRRQGTDAAHSRELAYSAEE
jgi:hypothetical protein